MAIVPIHFRCDPVATYPYDHCLNNVSLLSIYPFLLLENVPSTYWMAGLSGDAAHFFKSLFILVLYTLAMTLFVSFSSVHLHSLSDMALAEFPSWYLLPKRWYRHPPFGVVSSLPDDLCWILCPSKCYPSSPSLVTVVMSTEVYVGSAGCKRGRLWADDTGHATGCTR